MFYRGLGRAIKVARTRLELERKDLAERTGLSYAYLSDIETGRGRPSSSALLVIAKALGMDASSLLSEAERYMKPVPEVRSRYFRGDTPSSLQQLMPNDPASAGRLSPAREELAWSTSADVDQIGAELERLSPADLAIVLELVKRLAEKRPGEPG